MHGSIIICILIIINDKLFISIHRSWQRRDLLHCAALCLLLIVYYVYFLLFIVCWSFCFLFANCFLFILYQLLFIRAGRRRIYSSVLLSATTDKARALLAMDSGGNVIMWQCECWLWIDAIGFSGRLWNVNVAGSQSRPRRATWWTLWAGLATSRTPMSKQYSIITLITILIQYQHQHQHQHQHQYQYLYHLCRHAYKIVRKESTPKLVFGVALTLTVKEEKIVALQQSISISRIDYNSFDVESNFNTILMTLSFWMVW